MLVLLGLVCAEVKDPTVKVGSQVFRKLSRSGRYSVGIITSPLALAMLTMLQVCSLVNAGSRSFSISNNFARERAPRGGGSTVAVVMGRVIMF